MKGYKTLTANISALIVAVLAATGIGIDPETINAAVLGVFAIVNIVLRFVTDGPVGAK